MTSDGLICYLSRVLWNQNLTSNEIFSIFDLIWPRKYVCYKIQAKSVNLRSNFPQILYSTVWAESIIRAKSPGPFSGLRSYVILSISDYVIVNSSVNASVISDWLGFLPLTQTTFAIILVIGWNFSLKTFVGPSDCLFPGLIIKIFI